MHQTAAAIGFGWKEELWIRFWDMFPTGRTRARPGIKPHGETEPLSCASGQTAAVDRIVRALPEFPFPIRKCTCSGTATLGSVVLCFYSLHDLCQSYAAPIASQRSL